MSRSAPAAEAAIPPDAFPPVTDEEADDLFRPFLEYPRILVAVSGGPDSMALLHLAARWRARLSQGPNLFCASVDHRLRAEGGLEARQVADLCGALGIPHRILAWEGEKPRTRIQDAARIARYGLLSGHAAEIGAPALALAHTLDDQAETVLFRMARGSGLSGLCGMRPRSRRGTLCLIRPFLDVPKARLVATLEAAGLAYARDPSNSDPRFARPRLRALAPSLAQEGLDAARLALLARRMARADAALEAAVDVAQTQAQSQAQAQGWDWPRDAPQDGPILLSRATFAALPGEIALRLMGRAVDAVGSEGPVELGKLEAFMESLSQALAQSQGRFRRTLAGGLVTLAADHIRVEQAPARQKMPHPEGK